MSRHVRLHLSHWRLAQRSQPDVAARVSYPPIEMSQHFDIVEEAMKKRQWTCRRQPVEQMEAPRRWDCVYQCLLRWTVPQE